MLKATVFRMTPELWRKAKLAALDRETSLQKLMTDALEAYLQKKEVKK